MLVEKILAAKEKKIHQSPCHVNRASEIGHPCERLLYLKRTRWQEATLHDVNTQLVFDEGNNQERQVIRDLEDAGVTITEQQRDYFWEKFQLSAHIDGKLADFGYIPLEVKSMAPWIWQSVNTLDDLIHSKFPWVRGYPAQITVYLLLGEKESGVLILKNKSTGQLKEIIVTLDYSYAETLLKKCERVNAAVDAKAIPERIPYEEKVCGRCPFLAICLPEVKRDELEITTDPELEANLKRRHELAPLRQEYEQLDKDVKAVLAEHDRVVVGDFLVQGRWIAPKGKPKYWKMSIDKLEATKEATV